MKKCPASSKSKLPVLQPITTKPDKANCHCGYCPCGKDDSDSEEDDVFGLDPSESDTHRLNIIRRNKRDIKAMSKHVRKLRRIACAEASAKVVPGTSKKEPKKKKKPRKKSSLLELITDERECACEIMARAAAASLHRHVGLWDRRADINADVRNPDPVVETNEQPKPAP